MASDKTVCTELAVGFGLLELDPLAVFYKEVEWAFSGTLLAKDFQTIQNGIQHRRKYYQRFWSVGQQLRNTHFSKTQISQISWEGQIQQASSVTVPKDLVVAGTSISIKAESNVIFNRSPHTLFVSIPEGTAALSRSPNWFMETAYDEYQQLYQHLCDSLQLDFPEDVVQLRQQTNAKERKSALQVSSLSASAKDKYDRIYLKMCHTVASNSANMFNQRWAESSKGQTKNHVLESLLRTCLRLGDNEYILCGLDKRSEFAVVVPDITSFKRDWIVRKVEALPALDKGQSEVYIDINLDRRGRGKSRTIPLRFHVEVRWSHRPFVNNPEGKLYKDFTWTSVPFLKDCYEPIPYCTSRLVGKGAYGVIYEATLPSHSEAVAVKEYNSDEITGGLHDDDERQRFAREVELQSRLVHPNILPILSHDVRCQRPWFAAPLAESNLEEIIPQLRYDFPRILHIMRQVLEGLMYAHSNNVVHRDLKPSNILVFKNDVIRIGDFGLSKRLDQTHSQAMLTQTSSNSMGTLAYAAPEQLQSFRDANELADVYAFGKTLIHVVTGEPFADPFTDTSQIEIDERWKSIVTRCTRCEPSERYQSIAQIIVDLDGLRVEGH